MDVVNAEQAKIAEAAGACAVMALERIPADIRAAGGVARMSSVELIESIQNSVSIPVMAKCRIGHIAEAQILQALAVDYIDESEVLTPADNSFHLDKQKFKAPFVCGARNLGEALRRINEGASMLRTKGEAGTGNIVEAVKHARDIEFQLQELLVADENELIKLSTLYRVPKSLLQEVVSNKKLPVVNFAAGGIATPADAALMMQLGMDGVFVGSGVFKSSSPELLAKAVVNAVIHYQDPVKLVEISKGLGQAMPGLCISSLRNDQLYANRTE